MLEHKIIITLHVPTKGFSPASTSQAIESVMKNYKGVFPDDYIIIIVPDTSAYKFKIECINTELMETTLEEYEDIYKKFKEMQKYNTSLTVLKKYNL